MFRKKLIFFIIVFLFYFSLLQEVKAFIDEDIWLNLYKDIESWIDELENKEYLNILTDWWKTTISERLNNLAWIDCIWWNISIEDFQKNVNWNIEVLWKYIKDICKTSDWKIEINLLNTYTAFSINLHKKAKTEAEQKLNNVYKISRIWLYSDWSDSNSPFDLIIDLENINKIIFEISEIEKYTWTDNVSLSKYFWSSNKSPTYKEVNLEAYSWNKHWNSLYSPSWWTNSLKETTTKTNTWNLWNSTTKIETWSISVTKTWIIDNDNVLNEKVYSDLWYTCLESTNYNLSWLDNRYLNQIISNIEKKDINNYEDELNELDSNSKTTSNTWSKNEIVTWSTNNTWKLANIQNLKDIDISPEKTWWSSNSTKLQWWNYIDSSNNTAQASTNSLKNDLNIKKIFSADINSGWGKCLDFFCILIEFSTYTHNLFWWWKSKLETIESIVNNSNNHFKNFAYTSMNQNQMTLAHWQRYFKNIKLKDLLSFNIIVYSRQIPLVNTDKNKQKEEKIRQRSPYSFNGLAEQYYSRYGLEFNKANSLENLTRVEGQLKTITDSANTEILEANKKYDQFLMNLLQIKDENRMITDILFSKQKNDNIEFLYWIFSELSSFTNTFEIYAKWLSEVVQKMSEKPVW